MTIDCVLGIDPGLTGSIAFYFPSAPDKVSVEDMPVVGGEIDVELLGRRIAQLRPTIAIIENVHADPKFGAVGNFKLGGAYHAARAAVLINGVPLHQVSPTVWKKHFRLDRDKELSRALARRLWPSSTHFDRKLDHNRAEAALIARYCAEVLIQSGVSV